jgi:aminoglycoside 6-adenylyltransferase
VLLDKDARLGDIDTLLPHAERSQLPEAAAFANVVNDFWYHALWTARKLRRGETLMALNCCDFHMKDKLLTVARWHAQSGSRRDTWHQSRFFEEWADPRLVADLRDGFAHYDPADVARALGATMRTFDWLARETATLLAFGYPDDAVRWITGKVDETLAQIAC